MNTRALLARKTDAGFTGVSVHTAGEPTVLGRSLWEMATGGVGGGPWDGPGGMLDFLIGQHPGGWLRLDDLDWAGSEPRPIRRAPEIETQMKSGEMTSRYRAWRCTPQYFRGENILTEGSDLSGLSWAYVFDEMAGELSVYDLREEGPVTPVSTVRLDAPQPDWSALECGADLSRCRHEARRHFPEVAASGVRGGEALTTRQYLGLDPMGYREVVAVRMQGEEWALTGFGRRVPIDSLRGVTTAYWIAAARSPRGETDLVPVALIDGSVASPMPGVEWVFPALRCQEPLQAELAI